MFSYWLQIVKIETDYATLMRLVNYSSVQAVLPPIKEAKVEAAIHYVPRNILELCLMKRAVEPTRTKTRSSLGILVLSSR